MKKSSQKDSFSSIYNSGLMSFESFKRIIHFLLMPLELNLRAAKTKRMIEKHEKKMKEADRLFQAGRYEEVIELLKE